jgi:hypothetical protein
MFFGLNEFGKALQQGEERRKSDRLDNARLYNDFLSTNPGATVQERMDFANNLIKETGAGLGGLPTKAQMQRNFDKYSKEQAKKEAEEARIKKERERKIALENRRLAQEIGTDAASMFGKDGFDNFLTKQFEEFDISLELIPAAKANAKDAAWTKWKTDNSNLIQSYMDNPTKENLEAVMTSAGTLWKTDATNAYEGRHKTWLSGNTDKFAMELEELARTATSVEDYRSRLKSLKLKYPDEAYKNTNFGDSEKPVTERRGEEYRSALNSIVDRGMSVEQTARAIEELNERYDSSVVKSNTGGTQTAKELVVAARTRSAQAEIDALDNITDQEQYDRAKAAIIAKYNADALPDFGDMDAQIATNIKTKLDAEILRLSKQAIVFAQSASTPEEYASLKGTLVAPEGGVLDTALADTIFENKQKTIKENEVTKDAAAAQSAVETSDAIVRNAVEDNLTADEIITRMETSLSAQQGREVKLDDKQKQAIQDQFGGATEELTARINQIAKTAMGEDEAAFLINSTKEEFIANFVENLTGKGIEDAENRFASMAETQFDIALAKVRAAADQSEVEKLKNATNIMEDGFGATRGVNIDLEKLTDFSKTLLNNSNVLGDSNPDEVGTAISADINGFLQNIAYELNIPMSQEQAQNVVGELARMATNKTQDGVNFLQDGRVTRAMVNEAFQRVHKMAPFAGSELGALENEAMNDALRAAKLDSITELMNLPRGDAKLDLFQKEYAKARDQVRKDTFDIHRGSVADDVAPAQTAVNNGTQSLTALPDATQLISASINISDQNAYLATLGNGGSVLQAVEKTKEVGRNLETASSNLGSEIQRLSMLLNSPLYNKNLAADRTTVQNELEALTNKKREVDNAINGLRNSSQQLVDKIKRGKGAYEAEQAAEVERLKQANASTLQQNIEKKQTENPRNPQYTKEEKEYIKNNAPSLFDLFFNPDGANTSRNRRRSNN